MDAVDRLFALVDSQFPEQKDFAAQIGITPSIVSEWRRGKSESFTKQKYIGKIAEILNTTTEYILTGNENGPAPKGAEPPEVWALLSEEGKRKAREYMEMLKALEDKR